MQNAADRKEIRRAEKEAKQVERAKGEVVQQIADTAPGRRYLYDRLASAHVFTTSYSADALQMAFNEGERNQGLQLLADVMQWCPEQFLQMLREANERRSTDGSNPSSDEHERGADGNGRVEGPDAADWDYDSLADGPEPDVRSTADYN